MGEIERIGTTRRYSDIVLHGGRAYFSGYVPETTPGEPIAAQTRDVLDQIAQSLTEIGSTRADILQATIWLADMADFPAMNAVWDHWIGSEAAPAPPARATTQARLADPRYRLEIQIVAGVKDRTI